MIFDSHAHYDDEAFDEDRDELLKSFADNHIEGAINIGASMESAKQSVLLAHKYEYIYAAVGVHPSETAELTEQDMEWIKTHAINDSKVVAIGEIGLDYYWPEPKREIQKKWFERQLELAREVKLPCSIHSRDAQKDTEDMMKACHADEMGGVIHCYSYSKESARAYLDMGLYFGIGGVVTFKNGTKMKEVVEYIPIDRILLETDSPYLSPEPNRGKRNSSLNIVYIAKQIAEIKGIDYNQVIAITNQNTKQLFKRISMTLADKPMQN